MKGQNILTLAIYLFYSATLWGFTEQEEVTGLFSKDCILPCSFSPGHNEAIYWIKGKKTVHAYFKQEDQPKEQHSDYRGRTHLFHENIPSGNASLKLSNLTVTDEGTYKCYVGTEQSKTTQEVMLHIKVSSYYALEYQKTNRKRRLKCYAFLTYPAPHISWVQGSISIQEIGHEETRSGVLYSLRSDQNIVNTADRYSCRVHLPHEEWAAEWMMQDKLSSTEGSSTIIPCEYGNNTANTEVTCVWKLNRKSVTSLLASFNGTSRSYQPRAQINRSDFSLMLRDLSAADSGEYLCNISTRRYTKLIVRTLQVENSGNTLKNVLGVLGVLVAVLLVVAVSCFWVKRRGRRGIV